jgi:nitrite reductase/ring-hydroxylating ferredoxin subunit
MGRLADLADGEAMEKQILAHRYAVIKIGGVLHGIEADCKHMRASLAKGTVCDGVITCPWHGWRYDIESGQCLTNDKFILRKYKVEVDQGDVYLIIN